MRLCATFSLWTFPFVIVFSNQAAATIPSSNTLGRAVIRPRHVEGNAPLSFVDFSSGPDDCGCRLGRQSNHRAHHHLVGSDAGEYQCRRQFRFSTKRESWRRQRQQARRSCAAVPGLGNQSLRSSHAVVRPARPHGRRLQFNRSRAGAAANLGHDQPRPRWRGHGLVRTS